ncbi:MAG: hypothetical protein J6W74_02385 [Bacteroidales bacterium]|nr:hypothetical protein [Bacteroidales bacterium]
MKKIFNITLTALAACAIFVACSKENETPENNSANPEEQQPAATTGTPITITATLSEALTKVSFDPIFDTNNKPTGMAHAWQTGDKIRVYKADDSEFFDLDLDPSCDGQATGVFTGTQTFTDASYNVTAIPVGGPFTDGNLQIQEEDNATSHLQFVASATGVTDLSDITFSESSRIIGFIAKLPAGAAAHINELEIETSTDDFATSTKLNIQLTNEGDAEGDNILNVYANVPASWGIAAGTKMFLRFKSSDTSHTVYTRYQEFASAASIVDGKFNYIKLNCSNIDKYAGGSDAGTSTAPYLIADKYQMDAMHQLMQRGEKKYFKLIDDIDMTGIVWFPLNNGYPESGGTKYSGNVYDKELDFNGNDKTISNLSTKESSLTTSDEYASIFGVLMGDVYDLTIDNATITSQGKSGILAGYIGTGSYGPAHCEVRNVSIYDSEVNSTASTYCGILCGQSAKNGNVFSDIYIDNCEVTSIGYAAGLVAYFANPATVSDIEIYDTNITSSGDVNSKDIPEDGFAGGIAARINAAVDFDRCYIEGGTITGPKQENNDNSKKSRYVGGLVAYVGNVAATFDDCEVVDVALGLASAPATNNGRYIGGAFGYLGAAAVVGNSTACSVSGITMNNNVRNYVAGFVSFLDGATVKNSSASSGAAIGNTQYSGAAGGFVGYANGGTLYNNSTSVSVQGAGNPGGFVGWVETTAATFEQCSATGNVSATANNAGGFCGIDKIGATYTECSSSGTVSSTAGYVGGLIGYINADGATISKCYSTSTINATGNYVGGLVGVAETDTIEKSYYNGTVTGNSRVGGILGIGLKDDATTIKNCYSRGAVVGSTSEQRFGGIVGDLGKGGKVENCWSDATVNAGRVLGGIVGLACYQTWGDATAANNTITGCIAWNPEVKAAQSGNYGSSGAVIGHTSFTNVFGNCYRRSDMDYKNSYNCSGGEWNTTCVDQPDCNGTNWAKGTTPGTKSGYTYQQAYYGVAKDPSSNTVSSIARDIIGWDTSIWNFTGDYPTLK